MVHIFVFEMPVNRLAALAFYSSRKLHGACEV
jgi:hypothetical protein